MNFQQDLDVLSGQIVDRIEETLTSAREKNLSGVLGIKDEKMMHSDERETVYSTMDQMQTVTESQQYPEFSPSKLGEVTPDPQIRALKIRVTKKMLSYGLGKDWVETQAKQFTTAYINTENRLLTEIFTFGHTSAYPTYDAVPLFSTSHTIRGGTQPNMITSAMSVSSLETLEKLIMELKDYEGNPYDINGSDICLMVGPALWHTAIKLTESTQEAFTSDNQVNALSKVFTGGKYKVLLNKRINGTFANDYFLFDKSTMNEYGMLKRKHEWQFGISDWEKDGDSSFVKTADYSSDFMIKMYQFAAAGKPSQA